MARQFFCEGLLKGCGVVFRTPEWSTANHFRRVNGRQAFVVRARLLVFVLGRDATVSPLGGRSTLRFDLVVFTRFFCVRESQNRSPCARLWLGNRRRPRPCLEVHLSPLCPSCWR